MGLGPGGWADETYLKLALHALDEVAHHGGEIGLLRDLYLQPGPICAGATGLGPFRAGLCSAHFWILGSGQAGWAL
ncbi:hypothetical protein [Streptomyces sp. NPDC059616]|uniref:hypothetical protein n=1 Tax=Streptomyces sp. NPDC059616 TaxID=3346886 RepID=UPI00367BAF51